MTILRMRAAIVSVLQAALPDVNVEEFPRANMTDSDIHLALTDRHLALRVSFGGLQSGATLSSNEIDAPESWCIFILAKDTTGSTPLKRDVIILTVLPSILAAVAPGTWWDGTSAGGADPDDDDDNAHRLVNLRASEMFAGETDTKSAMIWGVTWQQTVSIRPATDTDIRDFLTLVTSFNVAPADARVDASDTTTLRS